MTAQMHTSASKTEVAEGCDKSVRSLDISVTDKIVAPTTEHNLLLGFEFGNGPTAHHHDAIVGLQLPPLDREQAIEAWWYKGKVKHTKSGSVRIAECHDYTAVIVRKEPSDAGGFREQTRQAYHELINAVQSTKHTRLVRIWNYFDDINVGDEDLEKYRQFSIGRAEAFQESGILDEEAPTGTAIGTQSGSGLALIGLASNWDFHTMENSRQVSAFHYPRKYGPRSPKFSRGGVVLSENHKLFLISGTAAVVGHESNFPYNTSLQANETFKNLDYLCDEISRKTPGENSFVLDHQSVMRVYLKNPDDYQSVLEKLDRALKGVKQNVVFLHGTICRKELTIEIDGVKVV